MIIKCKMCGGDIEFTPGATYGTCEYCGSTSTIPKADDEQKLNRYNRANHFRRQCEFDKALAAYEKILEQDDTDAEAHWGAALSRYGIEYVEDPATQKRLPTCHRVQVASILADADYLAAVENAPDAESRRLYEEQAAQIAEIQKGILAISANEKPYDVFICYKETDDNGQRTRDSQWAQDVYYGLTDAGYKVFFSRITLEDKLGQQYEPYIFAALNSAKVMVVIGSRPEYFNAVWVKNEWSRYLALMADDRKRLLIPCYRDMDPYDLPEELSTLQSQDMSKIGFMQDLLRGVKKVLEEGKNAEAPQVVRQIVQPSGQGAAPGVSSLMERAYLFMEDGDFTSANEYLNRVLDIDPKYAPAYAAKACVALGLHKESELAETDFLYEDNADWQKALRFADEEHRQTYEGYLRQVQARVQNLLESYAIECALEMAVNWKASSGKLKQELEQYRSNHMSSAADHSGASHRDGYAQREAAFQKAVAANEPATSEQAYRQAADMLAAIPNSEKAEKYATQCLALAEQARQKAIYISSWHNHDAYRKIPAQLDQIAQDFLSISEYKDASKQAQKCLEEAESERSRLYDAAMKAMQEAGEESDKWQYVCSSLSNPQLKNYRDVDVLLQKATRRCEECRNAAAARKKRLKIFTGLAAAAVVAAVVAIILVVTKVIIPKGHYDDAMNFRANGQWEEAIAAFATAGNYSDAETQIAMTYYAEGEAKRNAGDWKGAVTAFTNAGNYSDAETQVYATYYAEGEAKRATDDWKGAVQAFSNAGNYNDAGEQVKETYYTEGEAKRRASDWKGAVTAFTNAGEYNDAKVQITETYYQHAQSLMKSGDYNQAYALFMTLKGYADVDSLLANDENLLAAAAAREVMFSVVGNYVTFGTYPQTSVASDETPIEWLILARDGNKALLLSRYGIDTLSYNAQSTSITWEKCTLRAWLNKYFINRAFTAAEQSAILVTNVDNSSSQGYIEWNTSGGSNTQDKIFLLSYAEANKYLGVTYNDSNTKSRVAPTAYAILHRAWTSNDYKTTDGEAAGYWWLRSPGYLQSSAAYVLNDGSLCSSDVRAGRGSVRPALWVNIESGIF